MNRWAKRCTAIFVGLATSFGATALAEPAPGTEPLIAEHRQAALDAQKKAAFHEEMAKSFRTGRGGAKIDMVGHCRYWADYYRNVAVKEDSAVKELEKQAR